MIVVRPQRLPGKPQAIVKERFEMIASSMEGRRRSRSAADPEKGMTS
jgi:hypothetical protein